MLVYGLKMNDPRDAALEHAASEIRRIAKERSVRSALEAGREALHVIQQEGWPEVGLGPTRMDCRKGCAMCCYMFVSVCKEEAEEIANVIKDDAALIARIKESYDSIKGTPTAELIKKNVACPFLDADGACMIYDERPMGCRGFTWPDIKECEQFFSNPENDQDVPPRQLFDIMLVGAVAEGLTPQRYELRSALLNALGHDVEPLLDG